MVQLPKYTTLKGQSLLTMLIEVPIAILANWGRTDDGQHAMTKAHLTFD